MSRIFLSIFLFFPLYLRAAFPEDFMFKSLTTTNPSCLLESPVDKPFAKISKTEEGFVYSSMSGEVMGRCKVTCGCIDTIEVKDSKQKLLGTIKRETFALFLQNMIFSIQKISLWRKER